MRPDEAFFRKNSRTELPLSSAQQSVMNWFVKNRQTETVNRNAMIDMDACKGINGIKATTVEENKQWTRNKREEVEKDKTERSILLEYIAEYFEISEMLGSSFFKQASLFDDWSNGVDYIAGYANGQGKPTIKLAIDLTSAEDDYITKDKIQKINDNITNRKLSAIKYFKDDDFDETGPFYKVPKIVITVKDKELDILCQIISNSFDDPDKIAEEMANLKLKTAILEESKRQLENQIETAVKAQNHYNKPEEKEEYNELISRVEEVKLKITEALEQHLEDLEINKAQ